jgi:hypothetical protein
VVLLNATSTIFSGWTRVRTGSALITTGGAIEKSVREQNGASTNKWNRTERYLDLCLAKTPSAPKIVRFPVATTCKENLDGTPEREDSLPGRTPARGTCVM